MRFEVPQFIELDDKIFGPLSFKEFAYVAGGCGLSYLLYRFIPSTFIAFLFILPVLTFAGMLAFYRPNNKPFIEMVQAAILYFLGSKLFIWKKEESKLSTKEIDVSMKYGTLLKVPDLKENKLKDLSFNLDVKKGAIDADDSLNLKI